MVDDRKILESCPLPLARGYRRYRNATEIRERHDAAYYLFEIYLKYVASVTIAHYLGGETRDHRVNAVLKGLARPSLGEWVRFLRETITFLTEGEKADPALGAIGMLFGSKEGRWEQVVSLYNHLRALRTGGQSDRDKTSLSMLLEELVGYRNRVMGHGAPLSGEHYEQFAAHFGSAFADLIEQSTFLLVRRLVRFEAPRVHESSRVDCGIVEFMGIHPVRSDKPLSIPYGDPTPRESCLHLLGEDGTFVSLDPLLVAHNEDVYILNEAEGTPEYLSYATGDRHQPSTVGGGQLELFERILGYQVDETRLSRIGEDVDQAVREPVVEEEEQRLGDYRIVREVGRGAMGAVFEAVQESLGRRVALKVLPGTFALDPKRLERFRREARATARIHHANIVPVYEVGESGGTHYYAMEYIDGPALDQVLNEAREEKKRRRDRTDSSTTDPAYIAHVVEQMAALAEGLERAHQLGLVHRDVKPSNILVDSGGRYVLVDFGLVREEEAKTLTRSGEMVGTLNFMSPEQVSRRKVDTRSDVYSLGVTLYEALTLRAPFEGETEPDLQNAILFKEPVPPRKRNARINRDLETIILHALEKHPDQRYTSAAEFAADLRRFLRYEPIRARPQSPLTRLTRRIVRHKGAFAAGATICVLVLILGLLLWRERHADRLRREAAYKNEVPRAAIQIQMARIAESGTSDLAGGGALLEPEPFRVHYVTVGLEHRGAQVEIQARAQSYIVEPIQEAVERLGIQIASLPEEPDAYYYRAKGFLSLGRLESALRDIECALKYRPDFVPAIMLRVKILEKQGKTQDADNQRRLAMKSADSGWASEWYAAYRAFEAERWLEAVETYSELLDSFSAGGEPYYLGASMEARLGRGIARMRAGKFLHALRDFPVVGSKARASFVPQLLTAKTYYLMGEETTAEESLRDLSEKTPADRQNEVTLGVLALWDSVGDHQRGLDWSARLPESDLRERSRAHFFTKLGRLDDALQAADRAVELDRGDPRSWYQLGFVRDVRKEFRQAEEAYGEAVRIDPNNALAWYSRGVVQRERRRFDLASAWIEKAIDLDPSYPFAHGQLAVLREDRGALSEALLSFRDAVRGARSPRDRAWSLNELGLFFLRRRTPQEALAEFQRAIEADPSWPYVHGSLGRAFEKLGESEKAEAAYRHGISEAKSPRAIAWSWTELGGFLNRAGSDAALEAFQKAIEADPTYASAYWGLAEIHWQQKEADNANAMYSKVVALSKTDREHAVALTKWGWELYSARRHDESLEKYRQAIETHPELFRAHTLLGDLYVILGRIREAEDAHRQAVRHGPDGAYSSYCFGQTLDLAGKTYEAIEQYCMQIERRPLGARKRHRPIWRHLRAGDVDPNLSGRLDRVLARFEEIWEPGWASLEPVLKTLVLGWLFHPERPNPDKAIRYARQYLEHYGDDAFRMISTLAEAHVAKRELKEAVLVLEKAVDRPGVPHWLRRQYEESVKQLGTNLPSYRAIDTGLVARDTEVLIPHGVAWRYFQGANEPSPPLEWTEPAFPDTTWQKGQTGFGHAYGHNRETVLRTILGDMVGGCTTLYIRHRFDAADVATINRLSLTVNIEDGFVAYLNGIELGRHNAGKAGETIPHDGIASKSTFGRPVEVELSIGADSLKHLKAKGNCLALQGLKDSRRALSFLLAPVLRAQRASDSEKERAFLEAAHADGGMPLALLAYLEGRIEQRAGKHREAVAKFKEMITLDKNRPEPFLRLVESCRAANDLRTAAACIGEALKAGGDAPDEALETWFTVGVVNLKRDPQELLDILESAGQATRTSDLHWALDRVVRGGGAVRINCGGQDYTTNGGEVWGKDRFFRSGNRYKERVGPPWLFEGDIKGTEDDPLYQTKRWFPPNVREPSGYRIPLPTGDYSLTFHFAEFVFEEAGKRQFSVRVEGTTVIREYDIFEKVGYATAFQKQIDPVAVSDGILDIVFIHDIQNPMISAIEIRRVRE